MYYIDGETMPSRPFVPVARPHPDWYKTSKPLPCRMKKYTPAEAFVEILGIIILLLTVRLVIKFINSFIKNSEYFDIFLVIIDSIMGPLLLLVVLLMILVSV